MKALSRNADRSLVRGPSRAATTAICSAALLCSTCSSRKAVQAPPQPVVTNKWTIDCTHHRARDLKEECLLKRIRLPEVVVADSLYGLVRSGHNGRDMNGRCSTLKLSEVLYELALTKHELGRLKNDMSMLQEKLSRFREIVEELESMDTSR